MDAAQHQHSSRRTEGRRLGEERSEEEEVSQFNGMIHDDSDIASKCNRCREKLGRIVSNPYQRICVDCQSVIDRSLARFYAKAAVKKAIKRAKKRPASRSN
jgi:hypothetical protein